MDLDRKTNHKENTQDWWDESYVASEGFRYSKEPSSFLLKFCDHFRPSGKVLEIACGEGRNAVALATKGFQVTAVDFSKSALERAKKLAEESNVQITFKSLDLDFFIPELLTYDAIVSVDFRPPPTLMKNLSRGLKQNGYLLAEAYLVEAAKEIQKVEAFECFKPNELLASFHGPASGFRILHYAEIDDKLPQKALLLAQKIQLL